MVVCLIYLLHHILSLTAYAFWENRDFVFIIIVQFMMSASSQIRFGFVFTLHYLIIIIVQFFWIHWTYKMPVMYILSSVWLRLNIFSQLSIIQNVGLYFLSLPISLEMTENIYIVSYYHQIGSMNYYSLFMVTSWNNGMCCMSLYII